MAAKKEHPFPSTAGAAGEMPGRVPGPSADMAHPQSEPSRDPASTQGVCLRTRASLAPIPGRRPEAQLGAPVGREAHPCLAGMLRFPRCHNDHTAGRPPRGRNLISGY